MKTLINWKVFFLLWIASILAVVAVLPYSLAMQANILQNLKLPIPLPAVLAIQVLQNAVVWIANILAAVLFGLGHLPAIATLIPLTPLVIARTVVLNGLLGIVFGWLYWKRGLEAAMISHFSADLVLHVLLAL